MHARTKKGEVTLLDSSIEFNNVTLLLLLDVSFDEKAISCAALAKIKTGNTFSCYETTLLKIGIEFRAWRLVVIYLVEVGNISPCGFW